MELIGRQSTRVVLTTFASNIARLETAIKVAAAVGREAARGRALDAPHDRGRARGRLPAGRAATLLDERTASRAAARAGCCGSRPAARASRAPRSPGSPPASIRPCALEPGDVVIFSSKIIPGNERTLYNLHNSLIRRGIEVITEHDHFVHVSGHPCRDEVEQMYHWIRPQIAIPVHGEARHLHEHLAFARRLGVPQPLEVRNGDLVRLAPAPAEVIDEVPTGRLVLENDELIAAERRSVPHPPAADGPWHRPGRPGARQLRRAAGEPAAVHLRRGRSRRASPVSRTTVLGEIEDAIEELDDDGRARRRAHPHSVARSAVRRAFRLVREQAADHRGPDHPPRPRGAGRACSTRPERRDDRPAQSRRDRGAGPRRRRRPVSRAAGRARSRRRQRSPRMA